MRYFVFALSFGRIGFEPPPFREWLVAVVALFAVPLIWSAAAATLLWRKLPVGWWLSVFGDAILLLPALYFIVMDAQETNRWTRINGDALWHPVAAVIVSLTLVLLLTRPVRRECL